MLTITDATGKTVTVSPPLAIAEDVIVPPAPPIPVWPPAGAIVPPVKATDPTLPTPWTNPLGQTKGGTFPARLVYVKTAYASPTGESLPSSEVSLLVPADSLLVVPWAAAGGAFGTKAYGWNCYVGDAPGKELLQNVTPMQFGYVWTEPTTGFSTDAPLPLPSGVRSAVPTSTPTPISTTPAPGFPPLNQLSSPILASLGLDQYGGVIGTTAPGGATGYFRVEKINGRWVFVTPLGTLTWLRACYTVHWMDGGQPYLDALIKKYAIDRNVWSEYNAYYRYFVARLWEWGFTALGEYTDSYCLPLPMTQAGSTTAYNTEQMPCIAGPISANWYGAKAGKFTSLIGLTPKALAPLMWRGQFADVFNPAYAPYVTASVGSPANPWIIGLSMDDADYCTGFGPSGTHPHLGWVVAVGCPDVSHGCAETDVTVTPATATTPASYSMFYATMGESAVFTDPVNYSKQAWAHYLTQKYGTVAALNAAWGATYTTFGSAGGWGIGTGVLDEAGQHAWIGNDCYATTQPSAVRADLDAFLGQLAETYFSAYKLARDAAIPQTLLFSPTPMHCQSRAPILAAAGKYCDAIQIDDPTPDGATWPLLQAAYALTGKPMFVWTTFQAQADSPLASVNPTGWGGAYNYGTQAERGAAAAKEISGLFALQATAPGGSTPEHCMVGIDWWEWTDKVTGGETTNFGLVDNLDNAYDGVEDLIKTGTDQWGHPTGAEAANHGDCLTPVQQALTAITAVLKGL